jgi:putative hemolysin
VSSLEIIYLALAFVFLLISAFFASAEIAFINLQKFRLKHLESTGAPGAKRVAKIMEHPERFLSTVLTGISFTETVVVFMGGVLFVTFLGDAIGTPVGIVAIALVLLIFAKVVPKTFAASHPERLALVYSRPVDCISKMLFPLVTMLSWIATIFSRVTGSHPMPRALLSREELGTIIAMGEEEGVVAEEEATMLRKVIKFSERQVRAVMTPRSDVIFMEQEATLADFFAQYTQAPALRYPVYEGTFDNIVGLISLRDVVLAQAQGRLELNSTLGELYRPIYFVPSSKKVGELFAEMRDGGYLMAVVVDEYGGTAGIVSREQLVEEIVGEIGEELVEAEAEFEVVSEHAFQVDGSMRVDEANEQLGLEIPPGDYETVAGFALSLLGHLPEEGERVKHDDLHLVITEVRGSKILKLTIRREPRPEVEPPSENHA